MRHRPKTSDRKRPPKDPSMTNSKEDKVRRKPQAMTGAWIGPKWGIRADDLGEENIDKIVNTCLLDSFMVALFAPHVACTLLMPFPELSDSNSFLSRFFELMKQNKNDEARELFVVEWMMNELGGRHDLFKWTLICSLNSECMVCAIQ